MNGNKSTLVNYMFKIIEGKTNCEKKEETFMHEVIECQFTFCIYSI